MAEKDHPSALALLERILMVGLMRKLRGGRWFDRHFLALKWGRGRCLKLGQSRVTSRNCSAPQLEAID